MKPLIYPLLHTDKSSAAVFHCSRFASGGANALSSNLRAINLFAEEQIRQRREAARSERERERLMAAEMVSRN